MAIVVESEAVLSASDIGKAQALAENCARIVGARLREYYLGEHAEHAHAVRPPSAREIVAILA